MSVDQKREELRATITTWLREKFQMVGRPIEEPEFEQTVSGTEGMLLLLGVPGEPPVATLERIWQHLVEYNSDPAAPVWDGRVKPMELPGFVRVFESSLVSPLGPCRSIRDRMHAAGLASATVWTAPDATGDAIYVSEQEAKTARKWVQVNIYGNATGN